MYFQDTVHVGQIHTYTAYGMLWGYAESHLTVLHSKNDARR